jgi:hypothetical protein
VTPTLQESWLTADLESRVLAHAAEHIVPQHLEEVRLQKQDMVRKTITAVKDRLTKEINYWDHRANELKAQELAGKSNAHLNSGKARQRADNLEVRLQRRLEELEKEAMISPVPPVVIGGALVVPQGLLERLRGERQTEPATYARETARIEQLAMQRVMDHERQQGRIPRDVSDEKRGYDIESVTPDSGALLFIEVKGRAKGAGVVTISKNEILTALNKPDSYVLAVVEVEGETVHDPIYIPHPFQKEPDFGVTSVNYALRELLARADANPTIQV